MLGKFDDLLSKEGETVSHYVHSLESSRNSTTNLKVSKWAAAVNVTAVVRSQMKTSDILDVAVHSQDSISIMTKTAVARMDVIKWNNKYYDVINVEEQYWKNVLQYYKAICYERLEFLGD